MDTRALIDAYYAAFNAGDKQAFLALLTEDVAHDINQGRRDVGKVAFAAFVDAMSASYREHLTDIAIMVDTTGTRAAAEFMVHGTYLRSQEGLPAAVGQSYLLPAGAFFDIRDGRIARVSTYYNLQDWIRQVSAGAAPAAVMQND